MTTDADAARGRRGSFPRALRRAPPSALFGLAVITVYLVAAVFAPLIAPFGEAEVVAGAYQAPDASFWLGTDQIGRDVLSRMIYGARNTLGIALATTVLSFLLGGLLGMFAAVRGGWFDQVVGRIVDALMSVPTLIFALMLLAVFGKSVTNLIIIIAMLDATRVFRLARAIALNITVLDYVEVARLRGEGMNWIMIREILPNIMSPLIAEFGLRFCFVCLTISALSFLGAGIQPPAADWGSMVAESKSLVTYGDLTPLYPAAALALLTISVNYVVDWVLHMTSEGRDDE